MMRRALSGELDAVEIGMAPMVNLMFLLLIFFIVNPVYVQDEAPGGARAPRAVTVREMTGSSILLTVAEDGRVYLGRQEIPYDAVRETVAGLLSSRGDLPVVVVADGEARSRLLVDVIDACRMAGAASVSIATRGS